MHIEDIALNAAIAQLGQLDLAGLDVRGGLSEITAAMPALFDVDGAGVLLVDESQVLRYVGSTDERAALLESVQESSGRGPCVQSLVDNVIVEVTDLLDDDRWPGLAELLVPQGVRAVLGTPVRLAGTPVGSLNVYKRHAHMWDESDRSALAAFNRLIERMISAAIVSERQEVTVNQLQHALEARVEIERAVGVVIAIEDVDPVAAFELIRRAARSSRRSVREIANEIVNFKKLP